ncbi:MAG: hypothetical protein OEY22_11080 [Candidatus Bathyarchaeota archaeon]|nr:hypothetical protein [Candidatus Bathyarchaeota archaeon]MDH5788598.1 hypothetical protein [Candidatus Bathyarchaeota archaeon]
MVIEEMWGVFVEILQLLGAICVGALGGITIGFFVGFVACIAFGFVGAAIGGGIYVFTEIYNGGKAKAQDESQKIKGRPI